MKKEVRNYALVWAILVLVFNVIVFVTPNEVGGMSKFEGSFWPGYIFIMISFVGQFACAWKALSGDATKVFYRLPMISISYVAVIIMLIAGVLCMVIPKFPIWLSIIICVIVLAFSVIAVLGAETVASAVEDVDQKVKESTLSIKMMIVDADMIVAKAPAGTIKEEVKKVYEAIRYSDPMSNNALAGVESQISIKLAQLSDVVTQGNEEVVKEKVSEILLLINERNKKCLMLK